VSALEEVEPIKRPVIPEIHLSNLNENSSIVALPYEARKHASDAPAGPVPTIRTSVLTVAVPG
jgi:hypothetical protein